MSMQQQLLARYDKMTVEIEGLRGKQEELEGKRQLILDTLKRIKTAKTAPKPKKKQGYRTPSITSRREVVKDENIGDRSTRTLEDGRKQFWFKNSWRDF